jgi:hypothetical protein
MPGHLADVDHAVDVVSHEYLWTEIGIPVGDRREFRRCWRRITSRMARNGRGPYLLLMTENPWILPQEQLQDWRGLDLGEHPKDLLAL